MIYIICSTLLFIGVLGLVVQAAFGMGHVGHIGGHGSGGHGGAGHGSHGHGADSSHSHSEHSSNRFSLLALLSPLAFFSLCIGAGATGLLLKTLHLSPAMVGGAALLGAIFFYAVIVRPVWSVMLQFASKPGTALEGAIASEAEVLTKFDASGKGLVRLNVDGQLVRVLAMIEPDGVSDAGAIVPGDRLVVTSVDGHSNTCRVARL